MLAAATPWIKLLAAIALSGAVHALTDYMKLPHDNIFAEGAQGLVAAAALLVKPPFQKGPNQ